MKKNDTSIRYNPEDFTPKKWKDSLLGYGPVTIFTTIIGLGWVFYILNIGQAANYPGWLSGLFDSVVSLFHGDRNFISESNTYTTDQMLNIFAIRILLFFIAFFSGILISRERLDSYLRRSWHDNEWVQNCLRAGENIKPFIGHAIIYVLAITFLLNGFWSSVNDSGIQLTGASYYYGNTQVGVYIMTLSYSFFGYKMGRDLAFIFIFFKDRIKKI